MADEAANTATTSIPLSQALDLLLKAGLPERHAKSGIVNAIDSNRLRHTVARCVEYVPVPWSPHSVVSKEIRDERGVLVPVEFRDAHRPPATPQETVNQPAPPSFWRERHARIDWERSCATRRATTDETRCVCYGITVSLANFQTLCNELLAQWHAGPTLRQRRTRAHQRILAVATEVFPQGWDNITTADIMKQVGDKLAETGEPVPNRWVFERALGRK
jgi:hypothetical protein